MDISHKQEIDAINVNVDKMDALVSELVRSVDEHANLSNYGPDFNLIKLDEEAIIKEFGSMEAFWAQEAKNAEGYDPAQYREAFGNDDDVSPEQQAAFEKAMDEYDDRGLGCRPDMMDDDCDIEGRPL